MNTGSDYILNMQFSILYSEYSDDERICKTLLPASGHLFWHEGSFLPAKMVSRLNTILTAPYIFTLSNRNTLYTHHRIGSAAVYIPSDYGHSEQ